MSLLIRPEQPDDADAVRLVHRLAFGRDDEGRLVDALRSGGFGRVALVAEDVGRVVGHILFSALPIVIPSATIDALALAPLAVVPDRQRRGVGSALVRDGLRACRDDGHRIVLVLGEPDFYARFGFSAEKARHLASPYSGPAFMALGLVPGALEGLAGEVRYPSAFDAF
ncbi:MAG TPA: N-acetyltransferase [Isosphaeraceae bacterium]|jgi:putative acetyltransferase|nr:N-acetyltransferase [Isosphaeraceae bacterium]